MGEIGGIMHGNLVYKEGLGWLRVGVSDCVGTLKGEIKRERESEREREGGRERERDLMGYVVDLMSSVYNPDIGKWVSRYKGIL